MSPMVDLGTYEFKDIEKWNITPTEYFMNDYAEEVHEMEHVRNSTKLLFVILDDKYEKSD